MDPNGFSRKIHALLPRIRERREEIETGRRMPRDLMEALGETGIFSIGMPRALGGMESEPADILRAIEMVAEADGSTGWCTMLPVGAGMVAGYMPEPGAKEVFADPTIPAALVAEPSGAAVRTADGVRVTGRWRFASGITHAGWVVGGCVIMKDGSPSMTPHGPEIVHVFLPASDVTIHDTWHVSGLRGTGSNDFSADDVFVPEQRVFTLFDPAGFRPEPLYQVPILTLVASQIAIVAVGIARSALDELTDIAQSKTPSMSLARMADKAVTQVELARLEGALGSVRSFLYDAVDDVWQTVQAGNEPTMRQRALARIAGTQASQVAGRVAQSAATLAGGTSLFNSSSLQRHARDADAVAHHAITSQFVLEDAGRALVGLEPQFPLF